MLTRPCKVTRLQTKSAVLDISTTGADAVDPLGSKLGAGGLAAELEFSLLAVVGALGTCC